MANTADFADWKTLDCIRRANSKVKSPKLVCPTFFRRLPVLAFNSWPDVNLIVVVSIRLPNRSAQLVEWDTNEETP